MSSARDEPNKYSKPAVDGPLYHGRSFAAAWSALAPAGESLQRGAAARGGVWLLIGDKGVGKTALAEELLLAWRASGAAAMVRDCSLAFEDLAELLLERLSPDHHRMALRSGEPAVDKLEEFLLAEARTERPVTLLFDDAENLPEDTLEWLALLFEAQHAAGNCLRIILAAKPTFRDRLSGSWFTSLRRYMGLPIGLTPLQPNEIEAYLKHRARHGRGPNLRSISTLALKRFYELSQGRYAPLNDLFDQAWSQAQLNAVDRITLVQLEPEASGDLEQNSEFTYPASRDEPEDDPDRDLLDDPKRTDSPAWVLDQAVWDALERDQPPAPPEPEGAVGFRGSRGRKSGYDYGVPLSGLESLEATAPQRSGERLESSAAYAFSPDYDILDDGVAPDAMVSEDMERAVLRLPDQADDLDFENAERADPAPTSRSAAKEPTKPADEKYQDRSGPASHLHPVETPADFQKPPRRQRPAAPPNLRVLSGDQQKSESADLEKPCRPQVRKRPAAAGDMAGMSAADSADPGSDAAPEAARGGDLDGGGSLTWLEICARSELDEIKARQEIAAKSVVSRVQATPLAAAAHDEGVDAQADSGENQKSRRTGSGFGNLAIFLGSFFTALIVISALIVFWPAGEPTPQTGVPAKRVSAEEAVKMKALAAWQRRAVTEERRLPAAQGYQPPPLTEFGVVLPRRKPLPGTSAPEIGTPETGTPEAGTPEAGTRSTDSPAIYAPATNPPGAVLPQDRSRASATAAFPAPLLAYAAKVPADKIRMAIERPTPVAQDPAPAQRATIDLAADVVADSATDSAVLDPTETDVPAREASAADPAVETDAEWSATAPGSDPAEQSEEEPDGGEATASLAGRIQGEGGERVDVTSEKRPLQSNQQLETLPGTEVAQANVQDPADPTPAGGAANGAATETVPPSQSEVRVLLQKAERSEANRQLTQPAKDGAIELYRQVLALDPGNPTASAGIERIHSLFLAWAAFAQQEGNLDRAARQLRKALWIKPEDNDTQARLAEVEAKLKAGAIAAGFEPAPSDESQEGASVAADAAAGADGASDGSADGADAVTGDRNSGDPAEDRVGDGQKALVGVDDAPAKIIKKPTRRALATGDIDSDQLIALIETGNVPAVSLLLEAGAPINTPDSLGTPPLFYAISYGNPNMVALLLDWSADVNLRNPSRETPLMVAARLGRADIAEQLLLYGANPNARNAAGWTALFLSAARGHLEVTQALIDAGAAVNRADPSGRTALSESASNGEVGTLAALIAAGADVNSRDEAGMTPLMLAAQRGNARTVRILLAADADAALLSREGHTAATLASEKGFGEIEAMVSPGL